MKTVVWSCDKCGEDVPTEGDLQKFAVICVEYDSGAYGNEKRTLRGPPITESGTLCANCAAMYIKLARAADDSSPL